MQNHLEVQDSENTLGLQHLMDLPRININSAVTYVLFL